MTDLVANPEPAANDQTLSIVDAITREDWFAPWFRPRSNWNSWIVFLSALFGLPISGEDLAIFQEHTGRTVPPTDAAREAWVIVGRRGGKSRVAALIALYLACFRDYSQYLAPGEIGTIPIIAADRKEARTVMRYLVGIIDHHPDIKKKVVQQTAESICFENRIVIELHTASYRAVRGYSLVAVICDEISFWRTDDQSANPDSEVIAALRPGMATIPGALLIAISSPYSRRGVLWDNYERHYGKDGDPIFVWKARTLAMNPALDENVVAEAYEEDEAAASAEYGAEFRRDIDGFVSREAIDAVMVSGRYEIPPSAAGHYYAFVDPSGGMRDSMTLAIGHRDENRVILDCLRECRAPFNPSEVVAEFASVLRAYDVTTVHGDRYGGEWPREQFREYGITYMITDRSKSDHYLEFLPVLNSGNVELLDHKRLRGQLLSLERRTGRSGRDTIDHPPHGHDDLANAVAGLITRCTKGPSWRTIDLYGDEETPPGPSMEQLINGLPFDIRLNLKNANYCGTCEFAERREGNRYFCTIRQMIVTHDLLACEHYVSDPTRP